MSEIDPYKANRQFERAFFQGVPEIPYSMYEQNSYSFHLLRYGGVPEQEIFENDFVDQDGCEILGTIRVDYNRNLIFEE